MVSDKYLFELTRGIAKKSFHDYDLPALKNASERIENQALQSPMLGHMLLPLYLDDRHEMLDILNRDP